MTIDELEPIVEQVIIVDGVEILIRSIDDLSRLDSYQDMNDYEIQKLMNYRESIATQDAEIQAIEAAGEALVQQAMADAEQNYLAAQANFEAACALVPQLQTVEDAGDVEDVEG